ncbi:hypothetical protein [Candidatus Nitrotoga sp. AM1P]|uniref:hypothetical protein n=1 Tax=Candidatus Nitrotoga sp. AM1P TaxID=2559597 RepID=UPI0010B243B7|nr:hypothetical protein [Candidatus Nitrotoga sp. AM1P]BBJ22609.1 hypothetical protein W01_05360 [Candidatus Nitrotoga sp. AM1P]
MNAILVKALKSRFVNATFIFFMVSCPVLCNSGDLSLNNASQPASTSDAFHQIQLALDNKNTERNLAAQEAMAKWTEYSSYWAFLGFLLSISGLFALLFSLFLNRKATLAAENAVDVVRESNAQNRVNIKMTKYWNDILARVDNPAEAIFPSEIMQVSHMVFLPQADIQKAMQNNQLKLIHPIIYGCLNYNTPHVKGIRQTRFSCHVGSFEGNSIVSLKPNNSNWLQNPIVLMRPATITAT